MDGGGSHGDDGGRMMMGDEDGGRMMMGDEDGGRMMMGGDDAGRMMMGGDDAGRMMMGDPDAGRGECTPSSVCRPAAGPCDVEERCGADGRCPPDAFQSASVECAPQSCAGGVHHPAAHCGAGPSCPARTDESCGAYQCAGDVCATSCSGATGCAAGYFCGGGSCMGLRANGAACSSASECSSGICTGSYADADGDGHGAGALGYFCGAALPANRATSNDDCCDGDARAFPGQTSYFPTARSCGGFDFDCDGTDAQQDESSDACQTSGSCGAGDAECSIDNRVGWASTTPACGASASYVMVCGVRSCAGGGSWCDPSRTTIVTRAQACR